jgi:hypothetical protein
MLHHCGGHTKGNPVLPISQRDAETLRACGICTVGKIFDPGLGITMHSHSQLRALPAGLNARIWAKVSQLCINMQRSQILRNGTHLPDNTIQTVRRIGTFSHLNRQLYKEALSIQIKAPHPPFTQDDGMGFHSLLWMCIARHMTPSCPVHTYLQLPLHLTLHR